MFAAPVELLNKARKPSAVLPEAVVLLNKACHPVAVFPWPLVLLNKAWNPNALLLVPVPVFPSVVGLPAKTPDTGHTSATLTMIRKYLGGSKLVARLAAGVPGARKYENINELR